MLRFILVCKSCKKLGSFFFFTRGREQLHTLSLEQRQNIAICASSKCINYKGMQLFWQ